MASSFRITNVGNIALAVSFIILTSAALAEDIFWKLNPRTVPPPAGASEELRSSIARTREPDFSFRKAMGPEDEEEWLELIKDRNAARPVSLEALGKEFSLTIARDTIEGVSVYRITPDRIAPEHSNHLFVHLHGGAYVFGGGDNAVSEAVIIAGATGIPSLSLDYRMPPAHPFPAAVNDTIAVYRRLLDERRAKSIAIGGTSAGGGLALATVHRMIALDIETPGAIFAGTPWADLTKTGDTHYTNEGLDRVLVTYDGLLGAAAQLYAEGHDLTDPLISPVYGDFAGFPPTHLVTGTRDLFLSDTARTHFKLRSAGAIADLVVIEGMSHAGYLSNLGTPESDLVLREIGDFFASHLRSE